MRSYGRIGFGCMVTAIGLLLLKQGHMVTGGTAGLSLGLSYLLNISFPVLFLAINLPFFLFSAAVMGRGFTVCSALSVLVLTLFTAAGSLLPAFEVSPLVGSAAGGMGVGLGVSILFANGSSLGGANILAVYLHRRRRWDPGAVGFAFDALVLALALPSTTPLQTGYSIASMALASLIISYGKGKILHAGQSRREAAVSSLSDPPPDPPGGAFPPRNDGGYRHPLLSASHLPAVSVEPGELGEPGRLS